ncbi:MAG: sensor histidine kinase [Bacteroidetes bacterium]|nr:sensor histidine kinase [Bacteroidota bacterium]
MANLNDIIEGKDIPKNQDKFALMANLSEIIDQEHNHFERAKYIVTRNVAMMLGILLAILSVANLVQGDTNMYAMFAGTLLSGTVLWVLFTTGKYKPAASIAMVLAAVLNAYNFMITSPFGHFVDFFWIAIMAVFVFFTLGRIWGLINLFVNIYTVVLILYLDRVGAIERIVKEMTEYAQVNFVINVTVAAAAFSYFFLLMLRELKRAEEQYIRTNSELSLINEEKTVMMKEIHHRVKNNLQVIMSILRLQSNEVKDEKTRYHLADSVNRISAMAMIHEKMYQSESLTKIDLKAYLRSLVDDLVRSYADKTEIEVEIKSELDRIEPKSIVPVALIFNELVSNSIKHAFKGKETGKITINVTKKPNATIQLDYKDNGTWENPDKTGFGLEMIEIFTDQLDGQLERTISNGTNYCFTFPAML